MYIGLWLPDGDRDAVTVVPINFDFVIVCGCLLLQCGCGAVWGSVGQCGAECMYDSGMAIQ